MGELFTNKSKSNLFYFCFLCITFLVMSSFSVVSIEKINNENEQISGAEILWIDADSNLGKLKLNSGFLHGRDEQQAPYNDSLIEALKPEEWRLYKYYSYQLAKQNNANITNGLSDHYAWRKITDEYGLLVLVTSVLRQQWAGCRRVLIFG